MLTQMMNKSLNIALAYMLVIGMTILLAIIVIIR